MRIYQVGRFPWKGGHRVLLLGRSRWWNNVGRNIWWVKTKEYRYYYCSIWCFLTDQRFCKGIQS